MSERQMALDRHACYRALRSRDARFDGRFFIGVKTTGIYCRPVCPAGRARFENCEFFPSAAAAQEAGFRPCLRCRPETVAHLGAWRGTSNTVARALSLIAEEDAGADDSLEEIAERVGVSDRHLRRLFHEHLGASPVAVLQTRRVLFAKQLLHETQLPVSEIALASGFGSIRRFNDVFRKLFQRPPTAIRKQLAASAKLTSGVTVRLRYRAPYDWDAMRWYLRARALDGLERVTDEFYERELLHEGKRVTVVVRHEPKTSCLVVTFSGATVRALSSLVAKVRRVFDLDADISAITSHLSADPLLAKLIKRRPGLRVPGAWDGFESAVRTVLGQQVTVEAGRKLVNALVAMCGGAAFPSTQQVLAAPLQKLKMPRARQEALRAMARAASDDPRLFDASDTVEQTVAKLCAVKGVGEWTAQVIALRAAREPGAFPLTDVGVLRASGLTERQLAARAEKWRPWRGYAAQHLWASEMKS
jgi:AraC family transcriptional regulator of adaptative response / DNA-3-methyladenine glycosylase II